MTYSSEVLADSPLAYWRLGDTSGTTATDSSGNSKNGTYSGGYTLNTTGLLTSDVDKAVAFDGSSGMVTVADATDLTAFTVECWIKTSDSNAKLVARRGTDTSGDTTSIFKLQISGGNIQGVVWKNGSTADSVTGTSVNNNAAHHVALTYDGTTIRLYLDGASVGTPASGIVSGALPTVDSALTMAGEATFANYAGVLDEVAYYSTALSGARIAAHYAAGTGAAANEFNFDATMPVITGAIILETSSIVRFDGLMPPIIANVELDNAGFGFIAANGVLPSIAASIQMLRPVESERNRAGAWVRDNLGEATWSPAVVPPTAIEPEARVVALSYPAPTIDGTQLILDVTEAEEPAYRHRIVVAGRDITFWRGAPTPPMDFQRIQPLGHGAATFQLPQAVVPFETPGVGDLAWLKKGATVLSQSVDRETNEVVSTDWRGLVIAHDISGGVLTIECGGHAAGRAALQDRQMQLIQYRLDSGLAMAGAIRQLRLSHVPYYGPTTGISLIRWGGGGLLDYINELSAKMTTLDGEQWTTMPDENGVYSTYLRDTETIHGTVYLDDARIKADLRSDLAEEPNQIFASGVAPDGMVVKFGAYPGLVAAPAAPYPFNDGRNFGIGTTNAETDTGDGIVVMGWRLNVTGFLDGRPNYNDYDAGVGEAIKDLKRVAGLPVTSTMTKAAWAALFDISATGYTLRGIRVLPAAATSEITPWRLSANGSIIARNPGYVASTIAVHRTIAMGAGFSRTQIRQWARQELGTGTQWRGTIEINTGAIVGGDHTPGTEVTSILRALDIQPGMNLYLPLFAGGIVVHVAGVSVTNEGRTITLVVDTKPGDTLPVWAAIQRDRDNRNTVHRSFFAQRRSADLERENTFDEVGGKIQPIELNPDNWTVFPVVAKQAGTIEKIRLSLSPNREFVVAVFGRKPSPGRLRRVTNAPLTLAGRKRWTEEAVYDALNRDYVVLYVAGSDEDPCGYSPGRKSEGDSLTGRWEDDASFPFVTFMNDTDRGSVLWVAVWVGASATVDGGRIMWPSAEEY